MLTGRIPSGEFEARWSRAQQLAREKGVDALLVWGKGGGTIDAVDNLVYLANYYPVFPYIADRAGSWSGLSYAAFILPVGGEPVLVGEEPPFRRDVVAVQDIRPSGGFAPDTVVETLGQMGLGRGRIGLVGGGALVATVYKRLVELGRGIEFVEMDSAIERLRSIKSPLEFELLREAAEVGNAAMEALMKSAATTGTTEADAIAAAYDVAVRRGAAVLDMACASGPHSAAYSFGMMPQWTTRRLQEGEIFHCDMYGAATEGYRWDFARSVVTGNRWSAQQTEIYDGAIAAVTAGIEAVAPGVTGGRVFDIVQAELGARGLESCYPIHGHSFGVGWEGPWCTEGSPDRIETGMCLAVECMAGRKDTGYVRFERNLLVHEGHVELLDTCPARL